MALSNTSMAARIMTKLKSKNAEIGDPNYGDAAQETELQEFWELICEGIIEEFEANGEAVIMNVQPGVSTITGDIQ